LDRDHVLYIPCNSDNLGGRFVGANHIIESGATSSSSSSTFPDRFQGTDATYNQRGRGGSFSGRGRGTYSGGGVSQKRDFHSREQSSFTNSRSYSDDVRSSYMDTDDDNTPHSNRQVSSTSTHTISFQPPEHRSDTNEKKVKDSHYSSTRYSSSSHPDHESNHYPNKRLRPQSEWNHRSIEENPGKIVKTLNFTKPPLKQRDMDGEPHRAIPTGVPHPHGVTDTLGNPGIYTRYDPRMEWKKYPIPTNTKSNMGDPRYPRQEFPFRRLQHGNTIDVGPREDGEIELGELEEDSFIQEIAPTMNKETTTATADEAILIQAEPQVSVVTRPISPVAAPPSGLAVALSRLADLQSQMEYQYAKYLILCKEHEICKVKLHVIKTLPIGFDAFREELEIQH
jgi:hypothetical protein